MSVHLPSSACLRQEALWVNLTYQNKHKLTRSSRPNSDFQPLSSVVSLAQIQQGESNTRTLGTEYVPTRVMPVTSDVRTEKILREMRTTYETALDGEDLEMLGINRTHNNGVFENYLGITIIAYLIVPS